MNKKETAAFEALKEELRIARALRFTEKVEPDVPIPANYDDLTKGFLFNAPSCRVLPACSSSIYHAFGRNDKTDSQHPKALYSTRLLALKAMRHEVEKECAKKLASIDKQIEAESEAQ